MDHPVTSSRAEIIRHQSELGCWEYAIGRPHPSLFPHVREYSGWAEQMAAPLVRREPPTEDVPVIINFGAPVRFYDQQDQSRWTDYGSFSTGAYDTFVLRRIDRAVSWSSSEPVDSRRAPVSRASAARAAQSRR